MQTDDKKGLLKTVEFKQTSSDGGDEAYPMIEMSEGDKKTLRRLSGTHHGNSGSGTPLDPVSKSLLFSELVDDMAKETGADLDDAQSFVSNTTVLDETKRELEDLQMRTIYTLVEDVDIASSSGPDVRKKLLFLTNKQARMFDLDDMNKFIGAFEITPRPKLVIQLFPSFGAISNSFQFTHHWNILEGDFGNHFFHCEESKDSVYETDRKIGHFLKTCVLPVAIQTNALVIVHQTTCAFANTFSELAAAEASKNGGKLPFTIMNFNWAAGMSTAEGTVASQLRAQSKRWKSREADIKEAILATDGPLRSEHHCGPKWMGDAPAGCTHYVVVDTVTKHKVDYSALLSFKNAFIQRLSEELPSIAFASMAMIAQPSPTNGRLEFLADYAARGLPLFLLDSRPRPPRAAAAEQPESGQQQKVERYPTDLDKAVAEMEGVQARLKSKGTCNLYWASSLAFFHRCLQARRDERRKSETLAATGGYQNFDADDGLQLWEALVLAKEEEAADEEEADALARKAPASSKAATSAASSSLTATADDGVNRVMDYLIKLNDDNVSLEHQKEVAKLTQVAAAIAECGDAASLSTLLERACITWSVEGSGAKALMGDLLVAAPDLFVRRVIERGGLPWMEVVAVKSAVLAGEEGGGGGGGDGEGAPKEEKQWVEAGKEAVAKVLQTAIQRRKSGKVKPNHGMFPSQWPLKTFMAAKEILTDPSVYSGSLHDTDELTRAISKVARIDRLPSSNTKEELCVLRSAWDCVDVFNSRANAAKVIAKTAYALLLLCSTALTAVATTKCSEDDSSLLGQQDVRLATLVLSVFITILASAITYIDPSSQWHQLRAAALALESEVWKFRTRTGVYSISRTRMNESKNEDLLRQKCEELMNHVLRSASVIETSFFSKFKILESNPKNLSLFKHGQYQGAWEHGSFGGSNLNVAGVGIIDDHQSPLKPQDYLSLRVQIQLSFYQRRLPIYYRVRTLCEIVLVLGALTGTVLSFVHLEVWAPVAAAVTISVSSWLEFSATSDKLSRYSDTIKEMGTMCRWWESLTGVDKASLANIDLLVSDCEALFQSEHFGWQSTSMANSRGTKKEEAEL